ncbi:hypothetical protein LUZ61_008571 [Rhynchospora tenuis]|uniref:BTB domain-containing protein n=1 Tax=Rhynchospora tenuis TaxID=198213 RepID=A0AAD5ZVN5_9POAL|nr:hypothetical protein LUZ61_008571 [Rhynchospora tenuis]
MVLNEPNTVADCLSMVATATHHFKFSYMKTKELTAGKSIRSPTFSVAGHNCNILYYPQGLLNEANSIDLFLVIHCKSAVTASFGFTFLNKHGVPTSKACDRATFIFSPERNNYGFRDIIKRSDLKADFVEGDYFTLVCSVTIPSDSHKEVPKQLVNGVVPFSINENFAELLESKEMADITFEIDGELFAAHKLVLSARSPVFKAEFSGRMAESKMKTIKIKDIKPVTFKAMLHFIYTDSLPDMSDKDIPIVTQVQHLYKAADIYLLDGLKAVCEDMIIRNISVDTVISSLALAEEHSCNELKDVCLDFAAMPENLIRLALKAEYVELMHYQRHLLEEVGNHAAAAAANNDGDDDDGTNDEDYGTDDEDDGTYDEDDGTDDDDEDADSSDDDDN